MCFGVVCLVLWSHGVFSCCVFRVAFCFCSCCGLVSWFGVVVYYVGLVLCFSVACCVEMSSFSVVFSCCVLVLSFRGLCVAF